MSNFVNITSFDQWREISDSGKQAVYNFWASWCAPCKQMDVIFEELAKDRPSILFVRVEAEAFPEISDRFNVTSVPVFVFVKNGGVVDRVDGAVAGLLQRRLVAFEGGNPATAPKIAAPKPDAEKLNQQLNARLKALVNAAPIMIFIKGTPDGPRCGFSSQLVQILNKHGAKYASFDILSDDTVRQGLKAHSNWQTYPQLYVKGEFIGGVDIAKELDESGELKDILAAAVPKTEPVEKKLEALVKSAPVFLFMKGSIDHPKCGFSRQALEVLRSADVPPESLKSFDILEDEVVRQAHKEWAKWPTFPALYVGGSLVGGLDIMKEMDANGELKAMVTEALQSKS
mmetsp:Transcript_7531/g.12913  ORF Transcript_7531/g.12913 Transcript_7531/m.12913 type:complete len:343 (-) Transcript_7531:227-1255(-)|eukprot:CAMPEP_0196655082 /NCGR_PEP_ID=MMETSP1086-20130531/4839_1 /TAXON_ID=77921 /ORGANISM="Cyanoptyche  gloeocystis , Strain SAG4.97" /LENGTH=342 /DNA_ID=CAMNT_0041987201 /DNA_START=48 /DNA_END=1076 /DNA_ORIENTATION=-